MIVAISMEFNLYTLRMDSATTHIDTPDAGVRSTKAKYQFHFSVFESTCLQTKTATQISISILFEYCFRYFLLTNIEICAQAFLNSKIVKYLGQEAWSECQVSVLP